MNNKLRILLYTPKAVDSWQTAGMFYRGILTNGSKKLFVNLLSGNSYVDGEPTLVTYLLYCLFKCDIKHEKQFETNVYIVSEVDFFFIECKLIGAETVYHFYNDEDNTKITLENIYELDAYKTFQNMIWPI